MNTKKHDGHFLKAKKTRTTLLQKHGFYALNNVTTMTIESIIVTP
jgi:hypothetical protein